MLLRHNTMVGTVLNAHNCLMGPKVHSPRSVSLLRPCHLSSHIQILSIALQQVTQATSIRNHGNGRNQGSSIDLASAPWTLTPDLLRLLGLCLFHPVAPALQHLVLHDIRYALAAEAPVMVHVKSTAMPADESDDPCEGSLAPHAGVCQGLGGGEEPHAAGTAGAGLPDE